MCALPSKRITRSITTLSYCFDMLLEYAVKDLVIYRVGKARKHMNARTREDSGVDKTGGWKSDDFSCDITTGTGKVRERAKSEPP